MNTIDFNNRLIDSYLVMLRNVSTENKLDLIAKLSESIKTSLHQNRSIDRFYGCWDSDESAEEMIANIRAARTFNRQREEL